MQGDRTADDLGNVGGDGDQFSLRPVGDAGRCSGPVAHRFRQRGTGDQAQLGAEVLHQTRHHVGRDDHPHQQEAELRPCGDVGRDVARVDVGDCGDEGRAEEGPTGSGRPSLCGQRTTLCR